MPTGFDVQGFEPQEFFGKFALLAVGDVHDPALGIKPAKGHAERPGLNEIAWSASMKNKHVAEHCTTSINRSVDPTAAEKDIAIVQHNGLARSDGGLRLGKADGHFLVADDHPGRLRIVVVTNLG